MSFFKKYNGTMNKRLARLEKLIWVLIYGGLLSGLVGWFMLDGGAADGQWLIGAGGIGVVIGVVLIVVRSRLKEGPQDAAPAAAPRRPTR